MYSTTSSSSLSSSQGSLGPNGLIQFASVAGADVDSVPTGGAFRHFSAQLHRPPPQPQSNHRSSFNNDSFNNPKGKVRGAESVLVRQGSSPPVFFNHPTANIPSASPADYNNNGFAVERSSESYYNSRGVSDRGIGPGFTRRDPRESENATNVRRKAAHTYATAGYEMVSHYAWDAKHRNTLVFSHSTPSNRAKGIIEDPLQPQFEFNVDKDSKEAFLQLQLQLQNPKESVPCKLRAKRGCATHPRSIAERERRNRITNKLKKLQDLVPNMDKTSYADMLDLAVQHINGLQNQILKLNKQLENCTCTHKSK